MRRTTLPCLAALALALVGCGGAAATRPGPAEPYALTAPAGWQIRPAEGADEGSHQVLLQAGGTGSIVVRWRRGRPRAGDPAEALKAELATQTGAPVAVTARRSVRVGGVAADLVTLRATTAWVRAALAVRPDRDFAMVVATVPLPEDRAGTFRALDAVLKTWRWRS